jgi:hypothetical protein
LLLYICVTDVVYGLIEQLTHTHHRGKLWIMHGE